MESRNSVIEAHFRANYDDLVRRFTQSTPDKTTASAEDCVMEAYRRATEYFSVTKVRDFDGWSFRICINCLSDMFKDIRVREEHEEFDETEYELSEQEEVYDLDKRFAILEHYIGKEPEKYRDILRYYYINKLKIREINEIIPYSTTHIGRVLKNFADKFRKWVEDERIRI